MQIAVDAMGTDARPSPDVQGAVQASATYKVPIILVGNQSAIETELRKHDVTDTMIEIVHADDEVLMDDKPTDILKSKAGSSMHVGMNLVKDGTADAFVTMGNTGAAHAIATLKTLRRIPGVKRPALSGIYPVKGNERVFVDVGANTDCKPDWLEQFARMGSGYAQAALNIKNPRVGLLANGEEEGKGDALVREVYQRLAATNLNFIGNVEPKQILDGHVDVVVMDGFVGNIFTKTFEAAFRFMGNTIRDELMADIPSKVGGVLVRPAMRRVRKRIDTGEVVGGAPLLGVDGLVFIGHGSANHIAVASCIRQAKRAIEGDTMAIIREQLKTAETVVQNDE